MTEDDCGAASTGRLRCIHHVGHVVHQMGAALERYRQLGFAVASPDYPMISLSPGAPPRPFGAANTHIRLQRNFIELVTVVSGPADIPADARLIPLQVAPAVREQTATAIRQTVATLTAGLARYQGLHILVFGSDDVAASAEELDRADVRHGGVMNVQRQIDPRDPTKTSPVRYLEIDGSSTLEGRIAIAENPYGELPIQQRPALHPNGALDLVGSVLCVPDGELEAHARRYARYLGCSPREDGALRQLDLPWAQIVIGEAGALAGLLPGERAPALPAFVACVVTVRDIVSTAQMLGSSEVPYGRTGSGDLFVPAAWALGAAIVFRQG